jgi:hypothetical protein
MLYKVLDPSNESAMYKCLSVSSDCLNSLSYDEIEAYHDQSHSLIGGVSATKFHHRSTIAFTGTFDWIFSDRMLGFKAWLLDPCGPYWVQGTPGSGKTTLMRHIVDCGGLSTVLGGTEIAVAVHYFQADSSDLARTVEGMLRSLLWQIIQQVPSTAFRTVLERYQRIRTTKRQTWTRGELEISLIESAKLYPKAAVCFFVDGLDEHNGEDREITDYLAKFQGLMPSNTRLCISSRPYPDFAAEFESSKGFKMHKRTWSDILQYVRHRCEELKNFFPDQVQELSEEIISRAQGSFLWTSLVCDDLQKDWRRHRSPEALKERLQVTPRDPLPFYKRILDELDERETKDLYHMVSIVTESAVPLSSAELYYAMSSNHNLKSLEYARRGDWVSFDKLVRDAIWDSRMSLEAPTDWIQSVKRKDWVADVNVKMMLKIFYEGPYTMTSALKAAIERGTIGDEMSEEQTVSMLATLMQTIAGSRETPETAFDGAHMVEEHWLNEWWRDLWRSEDVWSGDRPDERVRQLLQYSAGWTYNDKPNKGGSTFEALRLVSPSAKLRHEGSPRMSQLASRRYDRQVELMGRGFIAIDDMSGEVHVAHETMLAFWQDASINVSGGKGHELLLIAHASCLVAIGRRYPAVFETQYPRAPCGDIAMSSSRSEHIFEHSFERHALRKTYQQYVHRYRNIFDYYDTSAGLLHYVSHLDARADLTSPSTLQCLLSIPFGCWLSPHGA